MTRVYLRLDPAYFEKKIIEQHYPLAAGMALIAVFCLAESQPERGRFRSDKLLRALMDKAGTWLPYLIKHGDVVRLEDGRLYAPGWDEWQEGDWKVNERVARIRARHTNGAVSDTTLGTVTSDTPGTVTNDSPANVPRARGAALHSRTSAAGHGGRTSSSQGFPVGGQRARKGNP